MSRKKLLSEIVAGMLGALAVLLLWKLAAPVLSLRLSRQMLRLVNVLAILSMGIAPSLIMARNREFGSDYGLSGNNLLCQVLTGIGIGLAMSMVFTVLPLCLGWKEMVYTGSTYNSLWEALTGLAYFVFVVGWTEEFVFRGFLYGKLKLYCLSDSSAVVISAVVFGLFHLSGFSFAKVLLGAFFCICLNRVPGCTVLSLAIAHGLHDWLIRVFS